MDRKKNKEEKKKPFFQLWIETLKLLKQCGAISTKNIEQEAANIQKKTFGFGFVLQEAWRTRPEDYLQKSCLRVRRIDDPTRY